MYKVNDLVTYGLEGVCKVDSIIEKEFKGEDIEYYVLKPVRDDNSTIFIPLNNSALVDKLQNILTLDEINELINAMPDQDNIWIDDDSKRKEYYKEIIKSNDKKMLIKLIRTLYLEQQRRKEEGKKLHIIDENYFKDAEKLVYEEFAVVLNIEKEDVLDYIVNTINKKEAAME